MSANTKIPPPRNLNIYRLVVARGLKQTLVAELFQVSPVRICQIVGRVRRWVDATIGDWLFPRRDDLRFYTALESAQIRVQELDHDPEAVLLTGPGWTYRREIKPVPQSTTSTPTNTLIFDASLSAAPLNSLPSDTDDAIAATQGGANESVPLHVEELGRRLAELLIVWQKSRRLSGAFKSWS